MRRWHGAAGRWGWLPLAGAVVQMEQFEEPADLSSLLRGVAEHRSVHLDDVAVTTPVPLPFDEAGIDQVGEDPLGGADGDTDGIGHVAQPQIRVAGDAQQHLRVVGHELPAATVLFA